MPHGPLLYLENANFHYKSNLLRHAKIIKREKEYSFSRHIQSSHGFCRLMQVRLQMRCVVTFSAQSTHSLENKRSRSSPSAQSPPPSWPLRPSTMDSSNGNA